MRTASHWKLGAQLADKYLSTVPAAQRAAFIVGNAEPDFNLFSYLKGWRVRPFYGHNWENAREYIHRTGVRLETKETFGAAEFFMLGRLVHFLCDAFTYAHNSGFGGSLADHAAYEKQLHLVLMQNLNALSPRPLSGGFGAAEMLHEKYSAENRTLRRDVDYILSVSSHMVQYAVGFSFIRRRKQKPPQSLSFAAAWRAERDSNPRPTGS